MSLMDEFLRLGHRDERPPCKVAEALEKIDVKHRSTVAEALSSEDQRIRRGVRIWLEGQGIKVSPAAMSHHRDKRCRCA